MRVPPPPPRPLFAGLLLALLACGAPPDEPRLDTVQPGHVFFGTLERLRLTGSFPPDLSVDLGSARAPSLDNRFEVRVGTTRATPVRFLSREALEITVPVNLAPGHHDVTVLDARGHETLLPGALEVIDRGIQRLVFVTSTRSAHAGVWSESIRIELRGPDGEPALTATPRALFVTSDSATGRFTRSETDTPLARLEVVLSPGESGVNLFYQDPTPGYHTLEASSLGLAPISQTVAVGRLGPPALVRFTQLPGSPLVAGAPVALAVEVLDASGGPASLPITGLHLELGTDSPAGGLTSSSAEPFHPALSLTLAQGRLPLLYRDTRAAAQVRLTARAINQDTLHALAPDERVLRVEPGPTQRFEVRREQQSLPPRAGEPERFLVQAYDAFGNPTAYAGPVRVETSPLDPGFSPSEVVLTAGRAAFLAGFTRVREVVLGVVDPHEPQVRGVCPPVSVRPGPPARLTVSPVDGPQRVGEPIPVTLEALDRFDNRVDTPLSVSLSAPGVSKDALRPTTSGTFTGTRRLSVMLTVPVSETHLGFEQEGAGPTGGLSTTTGGFRVRPGPTQRLVVEDLNQPGVAGVAFRVRVRAEDAHGNPSEDVHELRLGAEGVPPEHFAPGLFSGFKGQADIAVTLTQAMVHTRIIVQTEGLRGQQANTFPLRPGSPFRYEVLAPACVTPLDRFSLTLRALDAWGNQASMYSGRAQLSLAPSGTLSSLETGFFTAGVHTVTGVELGEVEDRVPTDCLRLSATDSGGAGAQGSTCLRLRATCPPPGAP